MEQLFLSILSISLTTGLVVLILNLFSSTLNRHFNMKWKYWIWMILAIRLLIPFNPEANFQQIKLHVPDLNISSAFDNLQAKVITLSLDFNSKIKQDELTLLHILPILWYLGSIFFLLIHTISYWTFKGNLLRHSKPIKDEKILQELRTVSTSLNLSRNIQALISSTTYSPMILGFLKPILILPAEHYKPEELTFILKHELIHVKRHDNYYKLILLISSAFHWFNPVIYRMVKEATIDLELSCDQEVIKDSSFSQRKAYTETIYSSIQKLDSKKIVLSTQFYGGTKIMKMRFENILGKQHKKNGFLMMLSVILLTLTSGLLLACTRENSSLTKSDTPVATNNNISSALDQASNVNESITATPEPTIAAPTGMENLSEDAKEIKDLVEEFASAYFKGDAEMIAPFLASSYEVEIKVYSNAEKSSDISEITLKGLSSIDRKQVNDVSVVSLEFKSSAEDDSFKYLTIELIKETQGWKISYYGIEG